MSAILFSAHGSSTSSDTALTVMSRSRSSMASTRVSTSAAAFDTASAPCLDAADSTAELARLTIAPPLRTRARRLPVDDQRRARVDATQRIELVEIDVDYRRRDDPAFDGVHDGVDPAERRDRLGEEPLHVQVVGDVGADGHRGAAAGEDRLDGRLRTVLVVEVVDDDGISAGRQPDDRRPAHAARPSGHDRHASLGPPRRAGWSSPKSEPHRLLEAAGTRARPTGLPRIARRHRRGRGRRPVLRGHGRHRLLPPAAGTRSCVRDRSISASHTHPWRRRGRSRQ